MTDLRQLALEADTEGWWYDAALFRSLVDGDDAPLFSPQDAAYLAALSPQRLLDALDDAAQRERKLREALRRIVLAAAFEPAAAGEIE